MSVIPAEEMQLLRERNASLSPVEPGAERILSYRTLREIALDPTPCPPLQIEGICREGEVGILTGPANRLKSRIGAELAIAVASGEPALGRFRVLRPGKALIIQNEIHTGVYDERMLRYADDHSTWSDSLLVVSRQGFRIDAENMLRRELLMQEEEITFAVLDPISEMWPLDPGFDENRATDVTIVLERLKELRDKNRTIIFIHHDPKDDARRARGSGRLIDAPDLRIYLSKATKKGVEVARTKVHVESRTMVPPDDFDVLLGLDGRLRHEETSVTDEQAETLDVMRRLGSATVKDLAATLNKEEHAIRSRLDTLKKRGKVTTEGGRPARWRAK
jgi:RecA-family ATPase